MGNGPYPWNEIPPPWSNPITSCLTVLLVKSVAAMVRTHPYSWAVVQPRMCDPELLDILDKVGTLPVKKRRGKNWAKEVGDGGWVMVWLEEEEGRARGRRT